MPCLASLSPVSHQQSLACRFPAWTQLKTSIPPLLQYPVGDKAFQFVCGLVSMFYAPTLSGNVQGLVNVITGLLPNKPVQDKNKKLS